MHVLSLNLLLLRGNEYSARKDKDQGRMTGVAPFLLDSKDSHIFNECLTDYRWMQKTATTSLKARSSRCSRLLLSDERTCCEENLQRQEREQCLRSFHGYS